LNSTGEMAEQLSGPAWLLLALVVALPLMKPAIGYPMVLPDLVFVLLAAAIALEAAAGRLAIGWDAAFTVLALYLLGLAPSMLASPDISRTALKLTSTAYLAGLAAAVIILVRDEAMLRRALLCWLGVTAMLIILAIGSLASFLIAPNAPLYAYSSFHFGTLPPGHYPRLALTFFNANMACNYLTVSIGLLFVAWGQQWIGPKPSVLLLGGILVAAAATLSPGLGGVALALGTGAWLLRGSRLALVIGGTVAVVFLLLSAFTPIIHPTATYLIRVPGTALVLAPSGRLLIWTEALAEFLRHPLVGHGYGIDAVSVRYVDPSGNVQRLTDAHSIILSIAAQAGLIGLAGLTLLTGYALRMTFSRQQGASAAARLGIGCTFLNAFLYQGLTGAFEDTRHLWVLFGLMVAAARISISPAGGNNRRSGGPSSC
jgi:O-antigen ligase